MMMMIQESIPTFCRKIYDSGSTPFGPCRAIPFKCSSSPIYFVFGNKSFTRAVVFQVFHFSLVVFHFSRNLRFFKIDTMH